MLIRKSEGFTSTETLLHKLAEKTFLKLWCYLNPFKKNNKELCDLIGFFENHIFIFFDKNINSYKNTPNLNLAWERWYREVVSKQIKQARQAEKYLLKSFPLFLDAKLENQLPIQYSAENLIIHKIIIGHGASEPAHEFYAGKSSSSMMISYEEDFEENPNLNIPFLVRLNKFERVHFFDSYSLEIIFNELDTISDFTNYLNEKERLIHNQKILTYCGEEDLLAVYFQNYNVDKNGYSLNFNTNVSNICITEGDWKDFSTSQIYLNKKQKDQISYIWDKIIQVTCQNALEGILLGNSDIFNGKSAIVEMAKESRFSRRILSGHLKEAIICAHKLPVSPNKIQQVLRAFQKPSSKDVFYVFLLIIHPVLMGYEKEDENYRKVRQHMLNIACGTLKNKLPNLKKVIGIAAYIPGTKEMGNSDDFILLECEEWTESQQNYYLEENKIRNFFSNMAFNYKKSSDF